MRVSDYRGNSIGFLLELLHLRRDHLGDRPSAASVPEESPDQVPAEVIDGLTERGFPLFYGALGENLTTRGIDVRDLRIGDQIRAGGAWLEITQPRGPCTALDIYGDTLKYEIYDKRVKALDSASPRWGIPSDGGPSS